MENLIPDKKVTLRTIATKSTLLGKLLKTHRKHNLYAEVTCQYIDEVGILLAKAEAVEESPNGKIILFTHTLMVVSNYSDALSKSVKFMEDGIDLIVIFISDNLDNFVDLEMEEELRKAKEEKEFGTPNAGTNDLLWESAAIYETTRINESNKDFNKDSVLKNY
jgi:hypothetical protein